MLNYKEFKEAVINDFMNYMPEDYQQSMKIVEKKTLKVNITLDGIMLVNKDNSTMSVSPVLYLNTMYEQYKNECSEVGEIVALKTCLYKNASFMVDAMKNVPTYAKSISIDDENLIDNIIMQVINTDKNENLLNNIPHREKEDLSIIYRAVIEEFNDTVASTIITNDLLKNLSLTEEQLFEKAIENTRRLFPPLVQNMNDVIRDLMESDDMPKEMIEDLIPDENHILWVITNVRKTNGAVAMYLPETLEEVAKKLDADLYILPSSVHEVLAVSAKDLEPYELAEMVKEVNATSVSEEQQLSDNVYFYDRATKEISLATAPIPTRKR